MKSALVTIALSAASATRYCPSQDDLTVAYTDNRYPAPEIRDQGWFILGGGGVSSLAAFNLLGGYVEFDIDLEHVQSGVNANVYAISPKKFKYGHFHKKSDYCDGAQNKSKFCLEVDWLETNGHCGAAMTIHALEGPGQGCTAWGCRASYKLSSTKYRVHVDYDLDGRVTVQRNGHVVPDLYPTPSSDIWAIVKKNNEQRGSVVYSSEWVGWVPREDCGTSGALSESYFTVSNLVVKGSVVKGPTPTVCQNSPVRRRSPPRPPASSRRRSRAGCADQVSDCRAAKCCQDPGKTCYAKDSSWASCRDTGSCVPGQVNPYEPKKYQTPWTCAAITTLNIDANSSWLEFV